MSVPAQVMSADVRETYSPIGLQIIDAFLNAEPIAPYAVFVDRFDNGQWIATTLVPTRTPSGVLTLPDLERHAAVWPGQPPRAYRLRVESEAYIPTYRRTSDGFRFLAYPNNDTHPPQQLPPANIAMLAMLPSAAYGYNSDVRVLRGRVTELNGGAPIRDAVVSFAVGQVEAMTDIRGNFALGIRHAPPSGAVTLDIHHDRTGRVRTISLQLPAALGSNQVITLN